MQLGNALEVVHAELLPEDKARIIETFKKEGSTAMIGDGINDAPALAMADIGISMGISGSALATETGHVILMSNDIRKVPKTIQLARKAHRKVIENIILSISTKSAILALGFAGHPLVWAAVLADVGTCLLVIFNSMLLLRGTHEKGRKCCKSSSAAEHTKKCDSTYSSHHHKPCCSNKKVTKSCEPQELQTCTSRCESDDVNKNRSCGKKCTNSANKEQNEVKHCSHGSCNTVDLEANNPHKHACSKSSAEENTKKCKNKSSSHHHKPCCSSKQKVAKVCEHQELQTCASGFESDDLDKSTSCGKTCQNSPNKEKNEVKHCGHNHSDQMNHHCISNHSNHSSDIDHCDDSSKSTWESGFNHRPLHLEHAVKNCCSSHNNLHCSTMDIHHACMNLEKRESGSCCKSYMKECCGKHGRFSNGFGGGLSEITIE